MSEQPSENPDDSPPAPVSDAGQLLGQGPIPLDYGRPPERPPRPELSIIGGVLGLIAGYVIMFAVGLNSSLSKTAVLVIEFTVVAAGIALIYLFSRPGPRRVTPIVLGLLGGLSLAALIQGICFAGM